MASSREIEKLERQYSENPEGMLFAPLANAYRNSGQPERAIEILTRGLELHPHHAPARIVLGRCHLDLGDDPGAEAAFAQVLDLDQENVIALKALADITDRAGRYDESIRWLNYLLEVDRNNDEARDQLARVSEAKLNAPPPPPPPPEPEVEPEEEAEDAPSAAGPQEEAAPEIHDEPERTPTASSTADDSAVTPPSPWQPPPLATEAMDWDDLSIATGPGGPPGALPEVPPEDDTGDSGGDRPPAPTWGGEATGERDDFDFQLDRGDEIVLRPSAQNEFQAPDASEGLKLEPGEVNEYQTPSASEGLTLHPRDKNEFQTPSDSDALGSGFRSESREEVEEDPDEPIARLEGLVGSEASEVGEVPRDESLFTDDSSDEWTSSAAAGGSLLEEDIPERYSPPEAEPPIPAAVPFEESAPWPGSEEESDAEPSTAVQPPVPESSEGGREEEISEPVPEPEPVSSSPAAETPPEPPPPASAPEPVTLAVAEPDAADAGLVVTETMAELYLSQGHRYEALEVYRVLARRSPADVRLREKVAALEAQGAEASSPRSYAVRDTGGRSVRDFFRSLLSARPKAEERPAPPSGSPPAGAVPPQHEEGEEGGPVYGQPTRPAQDPLSLSAVFGEDSSPVPPAVRGRAGESGDRSGEGFSFDSFFGTQRAKGAKPASGRGTRPSREEEEDLDQFNAWLQGLKG